MQKKVRRANIYFSPRRGIYQPIGHIKYFSPTLTDIGDAILRDLARRAAKRLKRDKNKLVSNRASYFILDCKNLNAFNSFLAAKINQAHINPAIKDV